MSLSTSSVSTATAIVFTSAVAVAAGSPTDAAVTVAVLTLPSAVPARTVTRTHTSVVPPGATVAVVVSGVVQVLSMTVAG